jgi:hypothetical protein
MAKTLISDILKPDVWAEYGVVRTKELSAFMQSGIVSALPGGVSLPNGGGTVNVPFFNDLTGDADNLSDSTPLTVNNITAGKQVAVVIGKGKAWSVNDLAGVLAGADPFKAVMDLIAGFWARNQQRELIATLNGYFAAASMAGNVSDISGGAGALAVISASTTIDAAYKLGDAADQIAAFAMHSATVAKLAKDNVIIYDKPADNTIGVPYYLGKRVIVDDGLPVSGGVYTSYLFAPGTVGYEEGMIGADDIETDRDILAGDSVAAMRRRFILHPAGAKWVGTAAGAFPTRTELQVGTNWQGVYPAKNVGIVQFKHKLA